MKKAFVIILVLLAISSSGQEPIKAIYRDHQAGFSDEMRASLQVSSEPVAKKMFAADLSDMKFPTDTSSYTQYWHSSPLSQGATGTCWCFATVSFLESEIKRLSGDHIKLSEMYIVYWEYVERARAFVEHRGDVYFAQGSEAVSVPRIMKKYGIVTESEYPGKPAGQAFHDHDRMMNEMKGYLQGVEAQNAWNTVMVVSTIREILNKYMGTPPQQVEYRGEFYTPLSFMQKVIPLRIDDYFSFMSGMTAPYNQKAELVEPDNWWHCDDYYNVSIDDFMLVIDGALDSACTVCMCGDISEPGYDSWAEVGIIPDFDIPSDHINAASRELRLVNGSTTDDHCIHIVGKQEVKGERWYMIKDSGAGGFNGANKGYLFLHEDYLRLKMMNIMVHKEAARPVLDKIIK